MKIVVETDSWAAPYISERLCALDVPEGSTVADVLHTVGLPANEAGIAVIRGKAVGKAFVLSQDDVIKIHPVIVGG